jgi:signal transduction histidine kinase/DNA-binding response OmpR family regulator
MRRLFCITVCSLSAVLAVGQHRIIDSLRTQLTSHPQQDAERADLLNELSFQIITSNPKESLMHAEEALTVSRVIPYSRGEVMARNNLAVYHLRNIKHDMAIEQSLWAANIADSIGDQHLLADAFSILATIYSRQREYGKARQYFMQAMELNLSEKGRTLCRILIGLGAISRDKKNYDSALLYYNEAIHVMADAKDEYRLADVINSIGTVYLRQGQNDRALGYFNRAHDIAAKNGNLRSQVTALTNIANVFIIKNEYSKGEEIENRALELAKKLDDKILIMQANLGLGEIKMETGKHHEAHVHMMEYYRMNDSIINAEKNATIAELELKYETEKKNKEIVTLAHQNQIQKLNQVYLLVAALVGALVFAAIYYLQRTHNKKIKALLKTQKQLNVRLKDADQLKSRFFATISHEFRTPLSLILAPVEAVMSKNKNSLDQKELGLIRRNANRLLALINQLLDLSKIEAKSMELFLKQGELHRFIGILTASFDSLAESKGIQFSKHIGLLDAQIWYDEDKLEKIISNLLFNAFKFTPSGGVVVFSIDQVADMIRMEVRDTGKGISPEEKQYVFAPYYQSGNVADSNELGTGLGLSLVNELVKLHGGEIMLDSAINKGTSIRISLPTSMEQLSRSASIRTVGEVTERPAGKILELHSEEELDDAESEEEYSECILVVEDNQDLRSFIRSSLAKHFAVITATNGEEGYSQATERIPDLILSDVMMPVVSGVQLTTKIKNDERTCHIPVILLTAKADQPSRMDGFRAGADDYLTKPFSVEELQLRVSNLIEQRKKVAARFKGRTESSETSREASLDDKFLLRVKQVIKQNLGDSGFGVEQLADEIHLSRAQLFRKLKAIIGVSPIEFINEMRLQKAAELISARADSLAQISYAVGFNEQSYFNKRFRKRFGMTPTEFSLQKP